MYLKKWIERGRYKYREQNNDKYKEAERLRQQNIRDNRTEDEHKNYLIKRKNNRKSIKKMFADKYDLESIKKFKTTDKILENKINKMLEIIEENPYVSNEEIKRKCKINRRKFDAIVAQYKL